MVIGDVRGKGTQAVTLVNTLLGTFHAVARQLPDLPAVVQAVEVQVQDVKARQDDAPTRTSSPPSSSRSSPTVPRSAWRTGGIRRRCWSTGAR
ncbi:SpoIIE family protein phosphatase [Streptomyces albogriseolus]